MAWFEIIKKDKSGLPHNLTRFILKLGLTQNFKKVDSKTWLFKELVQFNDFTCNFG